jgi:hypothetical protein
LLRLIRLVVGQKLIEIRCPKVRRRLALERPELRVFVVAFGLKGFHKKSALRFLKAYISLEV